MITPNKELGDRGEALARDYLEKSGYRIIGSNFRTGHLEIDLIGRQGDRIIFFEIKTRMKNPDSDFENPLTAWQIRNLQRAIKDYCFKNRLNLETVRLDLISIISDPVTNRAELRHYRDIF